MAAMICNCDTYGAIDYGMPILNYKPDYRTSTQRALKYIPPRHQYYYHEKTWAEGERPVPKKDRYKTHNSIVHDIKYLKYPGFVRNALPSSFKEIHYMRPVKEITFKHPPRPIPFPKSEYHGQYTGEQITKSIEPPINFNSKTQCYTSSVGKAEQPRIKIEDIGINKRSDIYTTTSQLSYIPFTSDHLKITRNPLVTIYNAHTYTELEGVTKPINDELLFKKEIRGRLVPPLVCNVPNLGLSSEYRGSYVPPTKGCFYGSTFDSGVDFLEPLPGPAAKQSLAAPNMYCTEHCHIGSGWPVCASVNLKCPKLEKQKSLKLGGVLCSKCLNS